MTFDDQFLFGPLRIGIRTHPALDGVRQVLRDWLALGAVTHADRAQEDLVFELMPEAGGQDDPDGTMIAATGRVYPDGSFGCWDGRAWTTRVYDEAALRWQCRVRNNVVLQVARWMPDRLFRLIHQHYFGYAELLASTFLYRHLIPAAQVQLLKRGATLIHASAIASDPDLGVGLAAWGGGGKTSASSDLYFRKPSSWTFLADDLAILDRRGRLHLNPMPLNVFPYNTRSFPELDRHVVEPMGVIERTHWTLGQAVLGPGSVVRRIPVPPRLVRPRDAQARHFFHLGRWRGSEPLVEHIAPAGLARLAANVLAFELRHALEPFSLCGALGGRDACVLPSYAELIARSEAVMAEAFAGMRTWRVRVPERYAASELGALVERVAASPDDEPAGQDASEPSSSARCASAIGRGR